MMNALPESVAIRPRLAVTRLTLTDFRCYAATRLEVDARPVVLTGPNGAGKTNLLEAVSFLAPGRGLRRAKLTEVDRRPAGAANAAGTWAVAAQVETPRGEVAIGTGREATSERRAVRIDGAAARGQTVLAEHMNLVWLTPQMDRLFMEGGAGRRRFLDRLVYGFDPEHAGRVAAYDYALRERARLLREGPADGSWLGALEDTMARHGVAVCAARKEVVERLSTECAEAGEPFPPARLTLDGAIVRWLGEMPALAVEDRLRESLAGSRRADAESGSASSGAHRSEFGAVHLATGRPAAECSTGEQKALLLAILLAHARVQAQRRGAAPVLLLDEVAAHLDRTRREALYAVLLGLGAQAWLTGTDPSLFAAFGEEAQFVSVADATLRKEPV